MWTYHLILPDPGDESLFMWQLWRAAHRDSHLSILEISSAFLIDTSFTWSTVSETAATPTRHHLTFFFLSLVTCAADRQRARDGGQHGKPKCCLSTKVLSVKLTPPLECHRTAWRHGGARFFFFFFFLWSPSVRCSKWAMVNSPPPVNPWGGSQENPIIFGGRHRSNWQQLLRQQSSQKERERETEREREREREREVCSPSLRDNRVNCTQVGLICFGLWRGEKEQWSLPLKSNEASEFC